MNRINLNDLKENGRYIGLHDNGGYVYSLNNFLYVVGSKGLSKIK